MYALLNCLGRRWEGWPALHVSGLFHLPRAEQTERSRWRHKNLTKGGKCEFSWESLKDWPQLSRPFEARLRCGIDRGMMRLIIKSQIHESQLLKS